MTFKPKNVSSESSTQTDPWVFVYEGSPQWRAWKRLETPGGKRWAYRYPDPGGKGMGCDVPTEWPPGYEPSAMEMAWKPPHRTARATTGGLSEYLADGGKLPGPGQHQGLHDEPMPGKEGRDVMPKRQITDLERRMLDWYRDTTHTTWAGGVRCTPYMRAFLDHMAKQIKAGSPF